MLGGMCVPRKGKVGKCWVGCVSLGKERLVSAGRDVCPQERKGW